MRSTYALKATMSPTAMLPSMASRPPVSRTRANPNRGSASMRGAWRARASAVAVPAQRSRCADPASRSTWACSWAKVRTTWAPWMFSSTIMATSAIRACVTQVSGKTLFRSRRPTYRTSGNGAIATSVRGQRQRHHRGRAHDQQRQLPWPRGGPNAKSSWMERMSLLAREMTLPRLGPVPVGERQLGETLIYEVAQIGLYAVGGAEQPVPVGEAQHEASAGQGDQRQHPRPQRLAGRSCVHPPPDHHRHCRGGGHRDQAGRHGRPRTRSL